MLPINPAFDGNCIRSSVGGHEALHIAQALLTVLLWVEPHLLSFYKSIGRGWLSKPLLRNNGGKKIGPGPPEWQHDLTYWHHVFPHLIIIQIPLTI